MKHGTLGRELDLSLPTGCKIVVCPHLPPAEPRAVLISLILDDPPEPLLLCQACIAAIIDVLAPPDRDDGDAVPRLSRDAAARTRRRRRRG